MKYEHIAFVVVMSLMILPSCLAAIICSWLAAFEYTIKRYRAYSEAFEWWRDIRKGHL